MTVAEFSQLITPIGVLLTAVGGYVTAWVSWDNKRILKQQNLVIADQTHKLETVTAKVEEVHVATNGLTARLEASAQRLGMEIGKAAEKANPSA